MVLLGFAMGTSDETSGIGKSLDEIISDRRKEQAKTSTGRATKDTKQANNGKKSAAKDKKTAAADRSIATGRAKRAAATKARRGLANNGEKKPTAMEIDKEVYRQARKTTVAKKKAEKKASNGRVAPNSSLRNRNNKNVNNKTANNNNSKTKIATDQSQSIVFGRMPQKKQIAAALKGMEAAGCPIPEGHQLVMQFAPSVTPQKPAKAQKNNSNNKNNNTKSNNNNNNNNKTNNRNNNNNNNKTNNRNNNNNNNNKTNNRNKKNGKK